MTSRKQPTFFIILLIICLAPTASQGRSFFQDFLTQLGSDGMASPKVASTSTSTSTAASVARAQTEQLAVDQEQQKQQTSQQQQQQSFTIGGLKPSNIASLLNTVSETGFSYFNVDDQCRSRTACDLGFMLYRKLNFVHNWIIRASVRTLVSSSNVYAQSWTNGMTGKNCTFIYPTCNQSPLDSLMNFALLAV